MNLFTREELKEPAVDFQGIQKKYEGQTSAFTRFPDGYYATPDRKIFIILTYMPAGGNGISSAMKMREHIDPIIAKLEIDKKLPGVEVHFAGGVQDMIEEFQALVKDIGISTLVVILLTLAVVIGFFKSWRGTVALSGALTVGALLCFGLSFFAVGYMNANSAFLGSIVIGNGINVGIMFLARYYEERRSGARHASAIETAILTTSTATWTAALAAGFAYGSLMATSFRGFSQFGVIGLIGMVCCWLMTFLFLPVFLTLIYGKDSDHPDFHKIPKQPIISAVARAIERFPNQIAIFSVAFTLASVLVTSFFHGDFIETDLSQLRDKWSKEHGSGYYGKFAEEIFGRTLSPTIVMASSRDEARKIRDALMARKKRDGEKSLMMDIRSIDDFLPAQQEEKIKKVQELNRFFRLG
jgi:predicted RND superfamily exporter protein